MIKTAIIDDGEFHGEFAAAFREAAGAAHSANTKRKTSQHIIGNTTKYPQDGERLRIVEFSDTECFINLK